MARLKPGKFIKFSHDCCPSSNTCEHNCIEEHPFYICCKPSWLHLSRNTVPSCRCGKSRTRLTLNTLEIVHICNTIYMRPVFRLKSSPWRQVHEKRSERDEKAVSGYRLTKQTFYIPYIQLCWKQPWPLYALMVMRLLTLTMHERSIHRGVLLTRSTHVAR